MESSSTDQPVENVGTEDDKSPANLTQQPQDPQVDTKEESKSLLSRATEAGRNLSPSEVPNINDVPAILGALIHLSENGELPGPLHERFPDNYPKPEQQ